MSRLSQTHSFYKVFFLYDGSTTTLKFYGKNKIESNIRPPFTPTGKQTEIALQNQYLTTRVIGNFQQKSSPGAATVSFEGT